LNFYDILAVDSVLIASSYRGLFRSTDHGNNWTYALNGLPDSSVFKIAELNSNLLITTDSGFYRSTDLGQTWTDVSIGHTYNDRGWNIFTDGQYIYVCTYRNGIFMTPDYGDNWISINQNYQLPGNVVFGSKGNRIFIGDYFYTGQGIWYQDMVYNQIENNNSSEKVNIYPNPFNNNLNLEYTLEKSSSVKIEIYDLTGRLIDEIINYQIQSAGHYSEIWKCNTRGTYFVRIECNDNVISKRIIAE
jgi:hypothetical protein